VEAVREGLLRSGFTQRRKEEAEEREEVAARLLTKDLHGGRHRGTQILVAARLIILAEGAERRRNAD